VIGSVSPGAGSDRWAMILAGGDGMRLRSLTRQIAGDERPKQFCPVIGGRTLLGSPERVRQTERRLEQGLALTER
jgi:mannose-1-phosphate guanylyltransferase